MVTELFIEGKRVDISAEISNLITYAIDDVKDFATRQTAFSKTVILPGTANNNALFGNIFDTGHSNNYNPLLDNIGYNFNASKSARCLIFQDNLQTFKGGARLLQINKDRGAIEYEVALAGELSSLNVALSSKFLADLDFSAYDEIYSVTNIKASWDNPGGSGLYYPLIDYGVYSTDKHSWDYRTFRPGLYVKEYIDKMFSAAGFRYDCALFNTSRFKSFIVPHNQKKLTKRADIIFNGITTTTEHTVDNTISGAQYFPIHFVSVIAGAFTNAGGTQFTYNGTETLSPGLSINISGVYNFNLPPVGDSLVARFVLKKNGVDYYVSSQLLNANDGVDYPFVISEFITITIATGDVLEFDIWLFGSTSGVGNVYIDFVQALMRNTSSVTAPVDYNEIIIMSYAIPQNVRQVDFLVSIVKLFNLYVYESQFDERLILITPFVDYYSADSGNSIDWTYKLNRDEPIVIKPMSELNSKIYKFNYKDDSDYYNDLYKKRYNQGYGSNSFDSNFEFTSNENKLELIFAATPLVGYIGEDKVYSTIFKKSNEIEEQTDSVIRILQTKKITGVANWNFMDSEAAIDNSYEYGYAGHLDDPDSPGNDLNFGVLKELFFILVTGNLTNTQFNVYWSSYMAEITDKDSKMLMGKFYLTPKDIFSLDFSKYIFLDGVLFRLNKIIDYNASTPSDCQIELIKVINTFY